MGLVEHGFQQDPFTVVAEFRSELYACLTARSDALFELCDALLCTDGPVRTFVELALAPEHRRGHGALYSGINRGRIDVARLRRALTGVPLPRAGDGRLVLVLVLVLAVDVSPWLRPDADTSSDRSFCHTFGRGLGKHQMVPGWPYSIVAALETGRTSWTALLDAIRLEPGADVAAVTADQVRDVVQRLVDAGQWRAGDPKVLVVLDAGYDGPRIAHLLADLPVEVLGRLRSDRVMRKPVPVPWICPPQGGRPPKHGGEFVFGRPETWGDPDVVTLTGTNRYGTATAQAWDRLHPRLTRRAAWGDHEGPLPIIEGTVIRLSVEKLPSGGVNKPVWLWWSGTSADPTDVDRCWQAFLRRFDVEHTFRLLKQTLGWTRPKLRDSQAADRWTWLVLAAHTQLRLARPSLAISAVRGRGQRTRTDSPLHESAAGSGTCARSPARQPVHRNPPGPAPAGHSDPRTGGPPPATASDESSQPARHTAAPHTTRRERSRADRTELQVRCHGATISGRIAP
ncbi:hypothetical protein OV450_5278 [Actinobacteria bacterium OV450]|nr:hypothetical protein OV450_5278 [Actinobacteria bacterium OV450]